MIRIGFIGCGNMTRQFLHPLGELAHRLTITALVDVDEKSAQRAAEIAKDLTPAKGPKIARDYHDIFDDVDAVIIVLPHDLHHRVTLDCIDAGKHVLLEKPMAISETQCLELIHADDASDAVLFIGYTMRYDPMWTHFGELIRGREYGDAFQVSLWTEQLTDRYVAWGSDKEKIGGGQLFSHGCHYIDLLLDWLGKPLRGTHVGTRFGTPWMQMEGTSNVSLEFEGGALAYHFGTWGARGTQHGYAVHAHCTEGMLALDHQQGVIQLYRDPSGSDLPELMAKLPPGATLERGKPVELFRREGAEDKATNLEVAAFLNDVEQNQTPVTNARLGLQSLRVIWRLYRAEIDGVVADLTGLGLDEISLETDPLCAGALA